MNDAVDRVLEERRHMSDGFVSGFAVSSFVHLLLVGGVFLGSLLFPPKPLIRIMDGFVALPRGGGGTPNPAPPAPAAPKPAPSEAPQAPEPPPKVIKPPKEEPRKGLPELDAKKSKKKIEAPRPSGGAQSATGTSSGNQGLSIVGPQGPGLPTGTDVGDWYLASVQQRIWMLWTRQILTGFTTEMTVSFTILADGSVEDVRLVQGSGVTLLDLAAQRAVQTAAPFGPLPKNYGTNRYTIQAVFKPTS